jgi:hypothetical protein
MQIRGEQVVPNPFGQYSASKTHLLKPLSSRPAVALVAEYSACPGSADLSLSSSCVRDRNISGCTESKAPILNLRWREPGPSPCCSRPGHCCANLFVVWNFNPRGRALGPTEVFAISPDYIRMPPLPPQPSRAKQSQALPPMQALLPSSLPLPLRLPKPHPGFQSLRLTRK